VKVLNAAGLFAAMIRPQHAPFLIVDSSIRSWLLACNVTQMSRPLITVPTVRDLYPRTWISSKALA
jgi:hypothetical protein